MDHQDRKPDPQSGPLVDGGSGRRDDTPSFIRNVQARAELLNPQRQSGTQIPVLTMPRSVRIWRTVRWPLFIFIVIIVLLTVGLVTNNLLVARSVSRTIEEAQRAEQMGEIDKISEAGKTLRNLAEQNPDRPVAQAAWAWQAVLEAVLFGPEKDLLAEAEKALAQAAGESGGTVDAARSGIALLKGDREGALKLAEKGIAANPAEPRLKLAQSWALARLGKANDARKTLAAGIELKASYVPFFIAGIFMELEAGQRLEALNLVEKLLVVAPSHLAGTLVKIELNLPPWGAAPLPPERTAALAREIRILAPAIAAAPLKLANLGDLLTGRIDLAAGKHKEAKQAFVRAAARMPDSSVVAWLAVATRETSGAEAALAVLDQHPDSSGPEILDLRAENLLAYHRVVQAKKAIDALAETGQLRGRLQELRWVLAVRRGDWSAAAGSIPEALTPQLVWPAVELYFGLKGAGDLPAILKLADALAGADPACAEAIRAWHGKSAARAVRLLRGSGEGEERSACVDALAAWLLRGHVPPEEVLAAAKHAATASSGDLYPEVALALTSWPIEGHATALARLDGVAAKNAEGASLRYALARAYLELRAPDKALAALEGVDQPDGIALRILAARAAGKDEMADKLVKTAVARAKETPHPALAYMAVDALFRAGKMSLVPDEAEAFVPAATAGCWTAEIAGLAARALNQMGDTTESDRLLFQTTKQISELAGFDESLEARLEQIELNIGRGGKHMYRALFLITEAQQGGLASGKLSFDLAVANLKDGNERLGLRYLEDALALDPTLDAAYAELARIGKLPAERAEKAKSILPWLAL